MSEVALNVNPFCWSVRGDFYPLHHGTRRIRQFAAHGAEVGLAEKHGRQGDQDREQHKSGGIRATLDWFHQHRDFAIIQFAATDETFAPVLARNREISIADTIRHLKDGIVEGTIRDADPEMLAQAIHGVVAELTRARRARARRTGRPVADLAVSFCLQGLRA